jgi:hypothetical protein
MPQRRPPQDGFSDSDQQWFDRLSGKPGPYDDERAVREADALRLALDQEREGLAREAAIEPSDEELEREWTRMESALERKGLLGEQRGPRWTWPALGGLAAAVVLSAGLLRIWVDPSGPIYDPPPVLRGTPPVRQIATPTPRDAAERFAKDLRGAGFKPGLYQKDGTFVVDIVLLPEQVEAARPAFAHLNLAPTLGLTRVIFGPR